ncbi:MAG: prepilin-type N-terminal cleavage/methylation domain-containing protein [Planctomycetaceae bacterium]|jgi:prepilin-type N-terminal cleavage/methylation domain-containing protein|nr:prepilin-type N-terminal cleavage/methylation domain-containing protein [Planctomycetaceae bacterium]
MQHKFRQSGYTLIEILLSLTVLTAGLAALSAMTSRAGRTAAAAEELSSAQLACKTRINEILAGAKPIAPTFREPISGLEHWFLSIELMPTNKPELTAVSVSASRERLPSDTNSRMGGANRFEITIWINNARIDNNILLALQQNPYGGMIGNLNPPNRFSGSSTPPFDTATTSASLPMSTTGEAAAPLSLLENETDMTNINSEESATLSSSERRRQYRESLRQSRDPSATTNENNAITDFTNPSTNVTASTPDFNDSASGINDNGMILNDAVNDPPPPLEIADDAEPSDEISSGTSEETSGSADSMNDLPETENRENDDNESSTPTGGGAL